MIDVTRQYDRETPGFCADILRKFGQNPYGENIYRIVWSESQFETMGGEWEERLDPTRGTSLIRRGKMLVDSNPILAKHAGYKSVSKYPDYKGKQGRWILEKWLPCSYTPAQWNWFFLDITTGIYSSGPYPEYGEFWCSKVLTDRGDYMEVTADVVEYYARLIAAGDEYADHQKREAQELRRTRKQRDYDNNFDAVWDDSQLAGGTTNLFQAMTGPKTNRKSVDDVKIIDAPKGMPTTPGSRQL